MLRRLCWQSRYLQSNPFRPNPQQNSQLKGVQRMTAGTISTISEERLRQSMQIHRNYRETQKILSEQLKSYDDHQVCTVELYMKHSDWRSQYVFLMMNYQQLGFSKYSDYSMLRDFSKFLGFKWGDSEKWPVMKFNVPNEQGQILVGLKQIIDFIDKKHLFAFDVQENPTLDQSVEKFINENIVPNLQQVFWHPRLTFEVVFHTDVSSMNKSSMNYRILHLIWRNMWEVSKNIVANLINIMTHKKEYEESRPNLEKNLKEVMTMLGTREFMGGNKPNHLDFYLFAILSTKMGSKHFEAFLRHDISGQLWEWVYRMKRVTKYEKDRLTVL